MYSITRMRKNPPSAAIIAIYVVDSSGALAADVYVTVTPKALARLVNFILPRPVTGSQPIYRVRVKRSEL